MASDRKAYHQAYYEAHKEQYAERDRRWSENNREKRVRYTLQSRAQNPERYKAYQKTYGAGDGQQVLPL